MTVTSHEFIPGASESVDLGGRKGDVMVRCYSDDPQDTGHAVLNYLIGQGFAYGAEYNVGNDNNPANRLTNIDTPRHVDRSCGIWEVRLHYTYLKVNTAGGGGGGSINDPTDLRPEVRTDTVTRSKPIEKAIYRGGFNAALGWTVGDERQITNSAGVPYVPAVELDFHNDVIRISRLMAGIVKNNTNFPKHWINSVALTINNGLTEISVAKYEMKFLGWSTEETDYEGTDLVKVTFSGEVQEGGWRLELLDRGVLVEACNKPDGRGGNVAASEISTGTAGKRNLMDIAGAPLSQPVNLNGNGEPVAPCTDEAHYGIWSGYKEIDPKTLGVFAGLMT